MAIEPSSVFHLEKQQLLVDPALTRYSRNLQNGFDVGGRRFIFAGKLRPSAIYSCSLLYCAESEDKTERPNPDEIMRKILRKSTVSHGSKPKVHDKILMEHERWQAEAKTDGFVIIKLQVQDCLKLILDTTRSTQQLLLWTPSTRSKAAAGMSFCPPLPNLAESRQVLSKYLFPAEIILMFMQCCLTPWMCASIVRTSG